MKTSVVICDNCNADLTETKGVDAYRLHLAPEKLPDYGSITFDVLIYPPIERAHHFCGLGCLHKWVEEKIK